MNKPKNPQASPVVYDEGMTLRDYFAAKAMQGMLGNIHNYNPILSNRSLIERSYQLAEDMLKEREKYE